MNRCIFVLLFAVSNYLYASELSTESIFLEAELYTLEIETEITMPFVEDEAGSFYGTGFLIDKKKGWVLTNAHVVGRSLSYVSGRFKETEYFDLKKIYIDPVMDLAVLQIDPSDIPSEQREAQLDCDSEPKTGHEVGTYGHPWGLTYTATRGIISGNTYLEDDEWLQIDAAVNSGNSGGPLLSLTSGLVVGVNSASVDDDDTEGLNFALPIRHVCTVVNLLLEGKDPSPPQLDFLFYQNNYRNELKIAEIIKNNTKFKVGDIIKSIDGVEIKHRVDLNDVLRGKNSAAFVIERKGEDTTINWSFKRLPSILGSKGIYFSGLLITQNALTDKATNTYPDAWIINYVESGTSAESNNLDVWEFVTSFNNKVFSDIKSLNTYLTSIAEGEEISLTINATSATGKRFSDYYDINIQVEDLDIITIE